MDLSAGTPQRKAGLDLLAAHLVGLDPETEPARDRLEHAIGPKLAGFLVSALVPHPCAQARAAA